MLDTSLHIIFSPLNNLVMFMWLLSSLMDEETTAQSDTCPNWPVSQWLSLIPSHIILIQDPT